MLADLNDIVLFDTVARTRSFTRSAQVLTLPKSTVSRRISRLEADLGQRLLERSTRQVSLTAAGEMWATYAARVVAEIESARDALSSLAYEPRGILRIALPVDFAVHWLAGPLASFIRRYPAIELELDLAPREVDVIGERFDAAIRIGRLEDSALATHHIAAISRSVYASPLYLANQPAPESPRDLARLQSITFPGSRTHQLALTLHGKRSSETTVVVPIAARANNVGMLRALTLAGAGIGVLPDVLCASELAAGRMVRLLPDWHAAPTQATLVMPSRKLVPTKLRAFIEHLDEQLEPPV